MLDKLNEKLSNLNQYLTLKNIAYGTAAVVAIVCAYKKYKIMWMRNEAKKLAGQGQQQALPQTSGMGNSMVVGPSPAMQMYAKYLQQQQQTQVPQRMPQTTTPPQRMSEAGTGWEVNQLHQHIQELKEKNRRLKAQAEGFPSMSMPDSVDDKGNPVYFEE